MSFKPAREQVKVQRIINTAWPVIVVILVFSATVGCRPTDDAWTQVQVRGILKVGLDPTYPPFENADSGSLEGIDVDLARALGETLDVEVEFVFFGFDGLYDALLTKQVDVLISALVIDISRTRDFAYSEPYFNAGQLLFVREERTLMSLSELREGTIAVELGSEGHLQALQWVKQAPDVKIQPLPTADDALWVVLQGEADAAIVDQVSGRLYQFNHPALRMVDEPITVEPFAIVTLASDRSLLEKIDEALEILQEEGQIEKIIDTWLSGGPLS